MRYEIKPETGFKLGIKELWNSKDLLFMLALRDFKVRYAQTFLGILWGVIQPFITLLIFTLIFGKAVKVDTGSVPYPIFALTGMIVWGYFSFVISQAGSSIINAQSIITKIYFPRLIIPISKMLLGLIDFIIAFVFLFFVLIYYRFSPTTHIIFLPFFILLLFAISSAAGIFLSSLSIRYRDVQYMIPFVVQIGLYISPVAYPSSIIPEKYHMLYHLNPLTTVIDGFRWCITGAPEINLNHIALTSLGTLVLLSCSIYYFRKVENIIADIV